MIKKPLISIIISTYNDAQYIPQTLESVLNQTYRNIECLVINDASNDNTESIIKEYLRKDHRVSYFYNKSNIGVTASLNKILHHVQGKYVARVDGDDYWTNTDKLSDQESFLSSNADYSMVGTWGNAVSENGNFLFAIKYPSENFQIKKCFLRENPFITSSVLIRNKDLQKVGFFDTKYKTTQDYDLWMRLGRNGKLHNIPKFMVNYRINPNGISQTKYLLQTDNALRIIKENRKYYPDYEKAYILWNLRKYYPYWLKGKLSMEIKDMFKMFS